MENEKYPRREAHLGELHSPAVAIVTLVDNDRLPSDWEITGEVLRHRQVAALERN